MIWAACIRQLRIFCQLEGIELSRCFSSETASKIFEYLHVSKKIFRPIELLTIGLNEVALQ